MHKLKMNPNMSQVQARAAAAAPGKQLQKARVNRQVMTRAGAQNRPQLTYADTYNWTNSVVSSLRQAMRAQHFKEIVPALLADADEPGARHSVAILGHYDRPTLAALASPDALALGHRVQATGAHQYFLPVSHVVEKQMSLEHLQRVYCLAPCLRLVMPGEENSFKHLYNFFQFEIEWRTSSMWEVFDVGEKVLASVGHSILQEINDGGPLSLVGNGRQQLESLTLPNFPKITFSEALHLVGRDPGEGGDLTLDDDHKLSSLFDRPFWIYDYPEGVRDSIYHKNDRGTYDTYDLMLPYGYGELTTGGIRPQSGAEIVEQSENLGKNYSLSYAAWKDRSQIQTAGFGIGLERLMRFASGASSIQDFVQYHDRGPNLTVQSGFFAEKLGEASVKPEA